MARLAPSKEVSDLLREIKGVGYSWRHDRNGHFTILDEDEQVVRWDDGRPVTLPSSPTNSITREMRAKLVKAGVPIRPADKTPKAERQDRLRTRIRRYLGNERRGDRTAFVRDVFALAEQTGVPIPYGVRNTEHKGATTREKSAYLSLLQFLNHKRTLQQATEEFWTTMMDELETRPGRLAPDAAERIAVLLDDTPDDNVVQMPQVVAEAPLPESLASDLPRMEAIERVILMAALAEPAQYEQTLQQARQLIAYILET